MSNILPKSSHARKKPPPINSTKVTLSIIDLTAHRKHKYAVVVCSFLLP